MYVYGVNVLSCACFSDSVLVSKLSRNSGPLPFFFFTPILHTVSRKVDEKAMAQSYSLYSAQTWGGKCNKTISEGHGSGRDFKENGSNMKSVWKWRFTFTFNFTLISVTHGRGSHVMIFRIQPLTHSFAYSNSQFAWGHSLQLSLAGAAFHFR